MVEERNERVHEKNAIHHSLGEPAEQPDDADDQADAEAVDPVGLWGDWRGYHVSCHEQGAEEKAAGLEKRLKEQQSAAELAEFAEALSRAEAEQRLTPAEAAGYLKLGSSLDREGRTAILEEVAQRRPLTLFRELSAPKDSHSDGQNSLERQRSRFKGFPEDPEHDAALELMAEKPELSFSEAIALVRERSKSA